MFGDKHRSYKLVFSVSISRKTLRLVQGNASIDKAIKFVMNCLMRGTNVGCVGFPFAGPGKQLTKNMISRLAGVLLYSD